MTNNKIEDSGLVASPMSDELKEFIVTIIAIVVIIAIGWSSILFARYYHGTLNSVYP